MKHLFLISILLLLSACVSGMSQREFVQANVACDTANKQFEGQVACMNDYLLTRNAESRDYDVYFTWVKERNAIMELYANGGLNQSQTKLKLLEAQNKYEQQLLNRDMRDIAAMQAMESRRPHYCHSYPVGEGGLRTYCD